ncbi:MAG: DNA/RNA nuclease SfsA [Eubacteriales bacterium]|nr:DNA/RNA nuclease SfsA [Eubacteriales bacterium]
MKYDMTQHAIFLSRLNRFVAEVERDGSIETVHVKNTGRCKELLLPGAEVILQQSDHKNRKTKYDLINVYKKNFGWVNIDSQAPNRVVKEWLSTQNYSCIIPEYKYGNSRIDFYMEKNTRKYLMEVKGCTLEIDGIGYFPDAPTERGVKHLRELIQATQEGYHCIVGFVIAMDGITEVRANVSTHPEFGEALKDAQSAGVEILGLGCKVTENTLEINTVTKL